MRTSIHSLIHSLVYYFFLIINPIKVFRSQSKSNFASTRVDLCEQSHSMSVILLTLRRKREQEGEKEIIAFFFSLSIGKAKGRKKKNRIKIDHFNFHNTIYQTDSFRKSQQRQRTETKQKCCIEPGKGEQGRERESAAFSSLPLWMYVREKNAKKKIIIYKSSTGCMQQYHSLLSFALVVVKLKQARRRRRRRRKRERENYMSTDIQLYSFYP